MDYGCFIYASARNSRLKILDPLHCSGLRMAIGAFRTSPTAAIYCESGVPPLKFRRDKLLLNYVTKIWALPHHPVHAVLFQNHLNDAYEARPTRTRPVAIRARELMRSLNIALPICLPQTFCETPPWTITVPICRTDLTIYKKGETSSTLIKAAFYHILSEYPEAVRIFTDGSKTDEGVGSAFSTIIENHSWQLSPMASIFTAELYAIWQALRYAEMYTNGQILIISDSLSAIEALRNIYNENPLVQQILALITWLNSVNRLVYFIWCPSHIGIEGNEIVDRIARQAAADGHSEGIPIINTDIKSFIHGKIMCRWQSEWDRTEAKLRAVKPSVEKWGSTTKLSRREQVVLGRLRIGHTNLTSLYLLKRERQPVCPICNQSLTVKHILLECRLTSPFRVSLGIPNNLEQILGNNSVQMRNTITFLKRCRLFNKI